jgi:hypothetical protein
MMDYKTKMEKWVKKLPEESKGKREKAEVIQQFKPAALKKCEPFMPDNVIYAEDKERLKGWYASSKDV